MLTLSLATLFVAAIALYISSKIDDDVFKAGMRFTSLAFFLITLFCAPWILKCILIAVPLAVVKLDSLSAKNL
ncbi:hypothetical protein IQ255_12870 [Pleurocapsales cyanobacterium LEGE 10410]|nr:hypothetical protein [Pleurocapsales cyanobacterium LEGE 10410]